MVWRSSVGVGAVTRTFVVEFFGKDLLVRGLPCDRRGWLATIGRLDTISLTCSETRRMEAHLRNEKEYTDKRQPARNTGEPESGPPGQQLDDVAVGEDSSARI